MRFVETPIFTAEVRKLLSDDEYRALQSTLLIRPTLGPVIPNSGGVRKLRWSTKGQGKRGGLRVIYYRRVVEDAFYMLLIYTKTKQDDLTPRQLAIVRRLVKENFG